MCFAEVGRLCAVWLEWLTRCIDKYLKKWKLYNKIFTLTLSLSHKEAYLYFFLTLKSPHCCGNFILYEWYNFTNNRFLLHPLWHPSSLIWIYSMFQKHGDIVDTVLWRKTHFLRIPESWRSLSSSVAAQFCQALGLLPKLQLKTY